MQLDYDFKIQLALFTALCSLVAGIIGAVFGAILVHKLTKSRERETWLRDCRIEEWRELLRVVIAASTVLTKQFGVKTPLRPLTEDLGVEIEGLVNVARNAFTDKIFISDEIKASGIAIRWSVSVRDFLKNHDALVFAEELRLIRKSIIEGAALSK